MELRNSLTVFFNEYQKFYHNINLFINNNHFYQLDIKKRYENTKPSLFMSLLSKNSEKILFAEKIIAIIGVIIDNYEHLNKSFEELKEIKTNYSITYKKLNKSKNNIYKEELNIQLFSIREEISIKINQIISFIEFIFIKLREIMYLNKQFLTIFNVENINIYKDIFLLCGNSINSNINHISRKIIDTRDFIIHRHDYNYDWSFNKNSKLNFIVIKRSKPKSKHKTEILDINIINQSIELIFNQLNFISDN